MDQEQLDYLLQSQYLPSTRDLNIGSMGVTPVLLQGTGLQTGTMGANPQLMTDDSLQVGSMGTNPQLMTDQFLQLGSMGANPFRGIQTVFRPNTLPALSDLGGMTPNFGVAEEEDVEQVESLGSDEPSGLAKLLEFLAPGSLISKVLPQESPEIRSIKNFYRRNYGLTPTGQVASGIMAGYNPVSGGLLNMLSGGRYGRPTSYGLAGAMQRRIENILGRKAPQTDASRAKIAELRDLQLREIKDRADRGESLSSIGKSTFSGPGMAFEQKGGGFSVKSDGSKRFYGGR